MARVILRDDPRPCGAPLVSVSLDSDPNTTAAGLADDPNQAVLVSVFPAISIKDRVADGLDDDDNPKFTWVTLIEDAPTVQWYQREESSNAAGVSLVKATAVILYPPELADVRETASAKTSDGLIWAVTSVARFPRSLGLELERVDDGD